MATTTAAKKTAPSDPKTMLTDEMLARFDERAPQYDRDNRFFREDFEELRDAGYLKIAAARPSSAAPVSASTNAWRSRSKSRTWPRRPRSP